MGEAPQEESMPVDKAPAALTLLKDWSIWLVGIQTGVFALIAFVVGEDSFPEFTNPLARWLVYGAIASFALSTVFATIVLGQIPTIRQRMSNAWPEGSRISPGGDFYQAPAWHGAPSPFSSVKLWWLTAAEHWLFVDGILLSGLALIVEMAWG